MKLELENTDDPRNHQFEDYEQIVVLAHYPETGMQLYEILTYLNGDFCTSEGELFPFDDDYSDLMRWEKIDVE